jgi:hypothetical protein
MSAVSPATRVEVIQSRICKCGHVSGIHRSQADECKADHCSCMSFREHNNPEPERQS